MSRRNETLNEDQESLISGLNVLSGSFNENEKYFDAVSQTTQINSVIIKRNSYRNTYNSQISQVSNNSKTIVPTLVHPSVEVNYNEVSSLKPLYERIKPRQRRTRILKRPTDQSSLKMLKDLLKNASGKDLSKIPMPCNFSEPLSYLQRFTEILEYSNLLDRAAECEDSQEQLAYVTAFIVSSAGTSSERKNKPFNPMLGETYECDRLDDLGWRSVAEQVSHHPPALAFVKIYS
jgi:hypothetical protein